MKLITRNTDYAIRALCFIASGKEDVVPVSRLVKELKIPRPFLRKTLQSLTQSGLIISYKGKGGGFSLGKNLNKIFLLDLIKIFQGPMKLNECLFKGKICPNQTRCALKSKIDAIEKNVVKELSNITIGSLLKK